MFGRIKQYLNSQANRRGMSRRSASVAGSASNLNPKSIHNFHQTKSENYEPDQESSPAFQEWYIEKCKRSHYVLPPYLPLNKKSDPYRLSIDKVTGITQAKKSNLSHQYLQLRWFLITDELDQVGDVSHYQCVYPIHDTKYDCGKPIILYYHSKVDRNCDKYKLVIDFMLIEMNSDGVVEALHKLGTALIHHPLLQDDVKNCMIHRQRTFIDLISSSSMGASGSSNPASFSYSIESSLELKNIVKLIPSECIVSPQQPVSGVFESYLPENVDFIEEEAVIVVNFKELQVQVPDKFEQQLLNAYRNLKGITLSNLAQLTVKSRKVACGFFNQYQYVSPSVRALEYLGKDSTGEYNLNVYELLGNHEEMKIPYYILEEPSNRQKHRRGAFCFSLLYQIEEQEVEVGVFSFIPNASSEQDEEVKEVSQNMLMGPGRGLYSNRLMQVSTKTPPAIMFSYSIEDALFTDRNGQDDAESMVLSHSNIRGNKLHPSMKSMKYSKKMITQQDIRNETRAMEEVERERLRLEREKEELEFMKTQHNFNYQEEFERRFEEQREQLRIKQALLEEQYRTEVEREIRKKVELEQEIQMMKERLIMMEEGSRMQERKVSYEQTPHLSLPESEDPHLRAAHVKQKVNPNYLVEYEKTIPVGEIREILAQQALVRDSESIQRQYRQFNMASKFTFVFPSIIWSPHIVPPKSFYMVIKFFNFQEFKTDPLSYIQSDFEYHKLIKLNAYAYSHEDSTPVYSFTVDPSKFANPLLLHQDLVNYLCKYNSIIDIFSAENHIYIGQINIKLGDLLRGSKSQVLTAKEYNIVKVKSQENYGVIQVLIKNEQADCQEEVSLIEKRKVKESKKKVISNNPITITPEIFHDTGVRVGHSEKESLRTSMKNRLEQRIENYKKKANESKANNSLMPRFNEFGEKEKGKLINQIHEYKEKRMPEYIKKMYEELLTETITINPYFGEGKTFIYEFVNMSQSPSAFRVSIHAEKDRQELELVKNGAEWKYYVQRKQNNYPRPKLFQCINDENSFYLSAGESIPLCFRYLSFEETNREKVVNVTVVKQENNWIIGGFSLNVQAHSSVINHSYVLYQPGEHTADIIMPVIYSSSDTTIPKRLFLTSEFAEGQWLNEYEILMRVRAPEIMSRVKFHMLLYEDEYFDRLKENWLVELHAYEGVCAYSKPEEKTKFKICIPEEVMGSGDCHCLKLFASHPDLVFEEDEISGMRLGRGGAVQTWCQLLPNNSHYSEIQITCTNQNNELMYGWVVQVFAYQPRRH